MKNQATKKYVQTEMELLDVLLAYKLNTESMSNSEVAINTICTTVDSFKDKEVGFRLVGITNDRNSLIHLVVKKQRTWNKFGIHTWVVDEKIEKGIQAKIHDSGEEDIEAWMETTIEGFRSKYEKFGKDSDDLIDYVITESLTGYVVSKKKFTDQCEFLSSNGRIRGVTVATMSETALPFKLKSIGDFIIDGVNTKRREIIGMIGGFIDKLKCDKLSTKIVHTCINLNSEICVAEIVKVIQTDGERTYQLKILDVNPQTPKADVVKEHTIVSTSKAAIQGNYLKINQLGDLWIAETRPQYYDDSKVENFGRLPYNFVDEGRILIGVPRVGGSFDIIIGGDPRVDKDPITHLKDILGRYIDTLTKNLTKLTGTTIVDGKIRMDYNSFEASAAKESAEVKPLQIRLKALKKMVDEYTYIVKKQESIGTDVNISDKVKYNHKEGKVSYNDFSISINDEMLKSRLFQTFEGYLVTYYRGETTEETILDDILNKIFEELKSRINSYSVEDAKIEIKLNDKLTIDLEIKTSKNKAKLIYLNGQRFNKNEVITVIREMTCYRSQEEANRFITNVGKLGLSVYIGMTSGFEASLDNSKKLFRFRKLKGRSNYTLILDTIEIPIKGKELVNTLFNKFIGETIYDFEKKVPKIIYNSVESSADYVKYKFLIDSAYQAFKDRSQEFLNKKVADVQGEFCKYWNTKGKRYMTAITLVGMSGHRYIIAYDNKDSYVFMDPEQKSGEKETYENGKYVCMIDQSNIKSNIGFDTVISKLMALKNDSVVAKTIYNLGEELTDGSDNADREADGEDNHD